MSTAEKIVTMETEGTTVIEATEKKGFLKRMTDKIKGLDRKKMILGVVRVLEGTALLGGGFYLGARYGRNSVAIPAEGTVDETEINEAEAEEGAAE